MRCAICDDQKFERNIIKTLIHQFERENNLECNVDEFCDAESFLDKSSSIEDYDAVFMDIYMADMNGFEASKIIYDKGFTGCIIFTTNSRDFAIESYSVEAYGYLVKPCRYDDFYKTMNRVRRHWEDSKKRLNILSHHLEFTVYYKDIIWIETQGKGCAIYVKNEVIQTSFAIGKIEDILCREDNFFRVGKSFIVNQNYILKYDDDFIFLKNSIKIPIPIRNKNLIKKSINDFRFLKM